MKGGKPEILTHLMKPNLATLCGSFAMSVPLLKTSNAERVTCPRCLKKMKAAAKKVAP